MMELREAGVTPHVAQKARVSAIDGRVTRHAGYRASQRIRKRIEEGLGCIKTIGGMRWGQHHLAFRRKCVNIG